MHAEHQTGSGLLLNVVIRKSAAILELLTGEDQALLVCWDALLVLDFGLLVCQRTRPLGYNNGLDEDQHTTTETENQVGVDSS